MAFVVVYVDINLSQERHNNILITLCLTAELVETSRKFIQDFTTWLKKMKEVRKPDTMLIQRTLESDPQEVACWGKNIWHRKKEKYWNIRHYEHTLKKHEEAFVTVSGTLPEVLKDYIHVFNTATVFRKSLSLRVRKYHDIIWTLCIWVIPSPRVIQ